MKDLQDLKDLTIHDVQPNEIDTEEHADRGPCPGTPVD